MTQAGRQMIINPQWLRINDMADMQIHRLWLSFLSASSESGY